MSRFVKSFFGSLGANTVKRAPKLVGMVHLRPLPGAPGFSGSVASVISKACEEARILAGYPEVDSVMVENMHDLPYLVSDDMGPEVVSSVAAACLKVREVVPSAKPVGVQVLAGANLEALAVAQACGLQYIRAENFVFAQVADEGLMSKASAGRLLRQRKKLGCDEIAIFADIKKKHGAHSITSDVNIVETAKAAKFFRADGVIITGTATGAPAEPVDLSVLRQALDLECDGFPVIVGSGICPDNVESFRTADAFIVGSYFKQHGKWENELDEGRIRLLIDAMRNL